LNLMIGTDPTGKGGIASVVAVLINHGFLRQHHSHYISSHAEGNSCYKLVLFGKALVQVVSQSRHSVSGIVHVHCASGASFVRKSILLCLARRCGYKTIFHLHGGGFAHYATVESSRAMQWWMRRTLEKSTQVLALSEQWANFLSQFAPQSTIDVLPNPVTLQVISHIATEPHRIVFLGRVEANKGIYDLLAAVSILKPTFPHIKLVIAGEGELDKVLEQAIALGIADDIEIPGWLVAEQKSQQLHHAAIFVLPSYEEGLPMALLEAMAMAKAVVVTSVGGIPSVVQHEENGLLIPPRQVTALVEALAKLLEDKQFAVNLGINARKTIEKYYSSQCVTEKLSAIYATLNKGS
jgi:glycosyltransferase involved in cell wall biosynthesis